MRLPVRGRLFGLFLFALAVRVTAWVAVGTRPAADSPGYLLACTARFAEPTGLFTELVGWEYLGFLVPFCTTTLGGAFPEAWVAAQTVLSSLVPVLLVRTGAALGERGAGWLAGLGYAVLPEAMQWDLYVLSDAWFALVLAFVFWILVRPEPTPRWAAPVALVVLAVSRPFGVPIVAALFLLHAATSMVPRLGLGRRSALLVALALPVLQQALSWRQGWSDEIFPALWQEGYVLHDDRTLLLPASATADTAMGQVLADPLHFLLLMAAKAVVLFVPVWPRFSILHNVIGITTLAPIVVLGFWGLVRSLRAREAAGWVAATVVAAITAIVAVTFIDFDWRYRLPLMPALTLFAARTAWPVVAWLGARAGFDSPQGTEPDTTATPTVTAPDSEAP